VYVERRLCRAEREGLHEREPAAGVSLDHLRGEAATQ